MIPRAYQPGDSYQHPGISAGNFLPGYGGMHPIFDGNNASSVIAQAQSSMPSATASAMQSQAVNAWHGAPYGPNSPWALQGNIPAAGDRYVAPQGMGQAARAQAPYMGVSAALTPDALAGYSPGAMTGAPPGAFSSAPQSQGTPAQQPQALPSPPPAPISPLLAMAMQQQMGAAQPQASGTSQGAGPYQNFIPPIQATPYNYQGGQQPLPIGGMWNQVAQQMAGPGFMQPGTSSMYPGFNPSLVAPPQGPHNIAQPASAPSPTSGGIANLGNLGVINSLYSPYTGGLS